MTSDTVKDRTPREPVDLRDLGKQLLEEAREGPGRAALTLNPGGRVPHQTVVALTADTALDPEQWNGPASVFVVDGRVRISGTDETVPAGCWSSLPEDDSEIVATEDTCLLLSVAPMA